MQVFSSESTPEFYHKIATAYLADGAVEIDGGFGHRVIFVDRKGAGNPDTYWVGVHLRGLVIATLGRSIKDLLERYFAMLNSDAKEGLVQLMAGFEAALKEVASETPRPVVADEEDGEFRFRLRVPESI
mgnify:FL=1